MTNLRNFVAASSLMLAVGAHAAVGSEPNIVIIVCDDLNDSIEGMGGHPQAKTPNIDRLTKRGVRFTNAAANCPICGPSRASLWSGLHPNTTGFYGANQQKNPWHDNPVLKQSTTLFELFTRNGYRNFATGKIHHNGHEVTSIFENSDGFPGFGTRPNFGPIPNDGKPENKRNGVLPPWMPEKLRETGGWGDGFGPIQDLKPFGPEYGWTMFYSGTSWEYRNGSDRDPMPDEFHAAEAVEFFRMEHDKPFLLTVGFSRPHSPWYAPKEYFDLFPLDSIQLTPILKNDIEDCAKILTQQHDIAQPWGWHKYKKVMDNGGEEQLRKWTQAYLACVAFVDDQTGKVLRALEASRYGDNTLVVFTSDHGYHMGEKEYIFKFSPWEESVRIPLVIAGPGVTKCKECTAPVSLLDIYPTLVDYAGLPQPSQKLDGFSLRPLLENPTDGKWDGPSFSLSVSASKVPVERNIPAKMSDQHFSIRTERYRYIRCRNGEEELYDHLKDPNEWRNLASRTKSVRVLQKLRKSLDNALKNSRPQTGVEKTPAEMKTPAKTEAGKKFNHGDRINLAFTGTFVRKGGNGEKIIFVAQDKKRYLLVKAQHDKATPHIGKQVNIVAQVKPTPNGNGQMIIYLRKVEQFLSGVKAGKKGA